MSSNYLTADNGVSSGVTGITQSAGNDGTLQIRTTTSGGTATTAVTVDNAQNVGLGVTPSAWNSSVKALQVNNAALSSFTSGGNVQTWLTNNAYYDAGGWKYKVSSVGANQYSQIYDGSHAWFNAPSGTAGNAITFTQAMTLDASARLLLGTTSDPTGYGGKLSISGGGHCVYVQTIATSGYACMTLARANATSGDQLYFVTTSGLAGIISSSGTSTTYGTSSDYRLKEDVQPMSGALAKVAQLKPVTYKWKADGSDGEGFIAHELQEIFPGAVVGEKDAVDEKGNIKPQNIDTSFLVATLTAAIQELSAQVTSLQATVETQATTIATLQNKIGA